MAEPRPRTDVALRAAHRGDLERVLFLLEAAGLPAEGVEEALGPSFVVALREGELVGVAGIEQHGPWGLLRSVAVRDDQRGTGLGRVLVEHRIEWARALVPGADIHALKAEWQAWWVATGRPRLGSVDKAFLGWVNSRRRS